MLTQTRPIEHNATVPIGSTKLSEYYKSDGDDDNEDDEESQKVDQECPICLDPRDNMYVLFCGHKVCDECKLLLIQHGQFNECPICRFPLTVVGLVARYNNDQIPQEIYQEMIQHMIHEPVMDEQIIQEPGGRAVRRHRHRQIDRDHHKECLGNVVCSVLGILFIFAFFFLSNPP